MTIRCPKCHALKTVKRVQVGRFIAYQCRLASCQWIAPVLPEVRKLYEWTINWWLSRGKA